MPRRTATPRKAKYAPTLTRTTDRFVVKLMNRLRQEEPPKPTVSRQEQLLTEIRDLLKRE